MYNIVLNDAVLLLVISNLQICGQLRFLNKTKQFLSLSRTLKTPGLCQCKMLICIISGPNIWIVPDYFIDFIC